MFNFKENANAQAKQIEEVKAKEVQYKKDTGKTDDTIKGIIVGAYEFYAKQVENYGAESPEARDARQYIFDLETMYLEA